MNERDEIMSTVSGLLGAIGRDDDNAAREAAVIVIGNTLCDLRRIAAAVEKLASANPDPAKPMSLRDLTPEERETIEGLRQGYITVVWPGQSKD